MSELNLSLYHLAEGGDLLELFEMRAEAAAWIAKEEGPSDTCGVTDEDVAATRADLAVLDEQIALYMAALPTKVDKVRAVWHRIETLIKEAAAEVKFQSKRGQHLKADLERLKDYSQRCMELIEWPANKPRKLMGRSGYLLLKANGGRPGVEITDEALVPDELCTVTVTMPASSLLTLPVKDPLSRIGPRVPSLSLIAEALGNPCGPCNGTGGIVVDPVHNNGYDRASCPDCGGSGKQSVPGARLKPVGQHVEVK